MKRTVVALLFACSLGAQTGSYTVPRRVFADLLKIPLEAPDVSVTVKSTREEEGLLIEEISWPSIDNDTAPAWAQGPGRGHVYVVLWLFAKDHRLPHTDTAAKRLAVYLSQQNIRATFVVGAEAARAFERRNRQDVIGALGQHEIAFCSEGPEEVGAARSSGGKSAEEALLRERSDLDDVQRILGQTPVWYSGAGSALAPEVFAAIRKWRIRGYFHRDPRSAGEGRPFWYDGLLHIFTSRESEQLRPDGSWSNLDDAKTRFQDFRFRVSSRRQGTFLNVWFRTSEFVQEQPSAGGNEQDTSAAPTLRSPEESEKAFTYFESLISYMKASSGVEFVTASDVLAMLRDTAQRRVYSRMEVGEVAKAVGPEVAYQTHEDYVLAPSEVFYLLAKSVAGVVRRQTYEPILLEQTPFGPTASPASETGAMEVTWNDFATAAVGAADYVSKEDRVPDTVRVGNASVSPTSFLVALAQVTQTLQLKGEFPETVQLSPAHLSAREAPGDAGPASEPAASSSSWRPTGLQAWTFKPARLGGGL